MTYEELSTSNRGTDIFIRAWQPAGPPTGVVVIVPGFNSHGGYYAWTAAQLTQAGFAAFAVDLRGRGKSSGERFYVETFDDYVGDVAACVAIATARHPALPLFLLGHSAGGVVSCLYALAHGDQLSGLICESFAFQLPAPEVALAVLKGISHLAPHVHVVRLKNEDFSRDPALVQQMNADALIGHEIQPAQTIAAMVRADEQLKVSFPRITLPVLILHGTGDKATRPQGSQFFYDTAGAADKTLKLYDGHFHDLLNDVGKDIVIGDITAWIKARVPAS